MVKPVQVNPLDKLVKDIIGKIKKDDKKRQEKKKRTIIDNNEKMREVYFNSEEYVIQSTIFHYKNPDNSYRASSLKLDPLNP